MKTENSSGNVYVDIGVANPEQMLRKALIVTQISQVLTQKAESQGLRASWGSVKQS